MTESEKQLIKNNEALVAQIASLNKQNELFQKQAEAYTTELRLLREQVDYLTKKLFGPSSEKNNTLEGQVDLFEDDALFKTAETTEEKTVVEEYHYKRKKRVGYKAELTNQLPVKEVHCELTGKECTCEWCTSHLRGIGTSVVHEEVDDRI